jgi:hypothetical protein
LICIKAGDAPRHLIRSRPPRLRTLKEETVTRLATITAASVLALGFAMATAQALPLAGSAAGLNAAVKETGLITHVDACNRVCRKGPVEEWGGAVQWHRHVGKACRPVKCTP